MYNFFIFRLFWGNLQQNIIRKGANRLSYSFIYSHISWTVLSWGSFHSLEDLPFLCSEGWMWNQSCCTAAQSQRQRGERHVSGLKWRGNKVNFAIRRLRSTLRWNSGVKRIQILHVRMALKMILKDAKCFFYVKFSYMLIVACCCFILTI